MGMNPFELRYPVKRAAHLVGRKDLLKELRMAVRSGQNTVLMGPEGSGKTALLDCAFDRAYRLKMAQENVLIDVGSFPAEYGGEDVYGYFADAIENSLHLLTMCGREEEAQALQGMLKKEYDSKKSRFDGYLKALAMLEFRMVFVLDCFENFTSSERIKSEHHDTLRSMVDGRMNLQLVVATNYDFNKTSLPEGARNSALLTRFTAKVDVKPLDAEQSQALLERCLEECEEEDFSFTSHQLEVLHSLSGGVPELLYKVAAIAYEELSYGERPGWEEVVRTRTLEQVRPLMDRWLKYMTDEQSELLRQLPFKLDIFNQTEQVAAAALVNRGVLVKPVEIDSLGRPIEQDGFLYNSELLADFCSHEDWLKTALEQNPFRNKWTPLFNMDDLEDNIPVAPIVEEEVTEHHRENGFGRLFRMLDAPAILQHVMLPVTSLLALPAPEEEREALMEKAAAQIAAQFIPEEVEQELDGFEEEELTLERRFRMVRANVDPEGLLSDELLDTLSHKCLLYLQIAFVVDDALQILRDFQIGDLSAQIVMYGKVLEQHLRDSLFEFFSREPQLRIYDTRNHREDPDSADVFSNMDVRFAFIGNFMHMIQEKKSYLGSLCTKWNLRLQEIPMEEAWWNRLAKDVNRARKLRNGGDHAGSETSEKNLITMKRLMLSRDGILARCESGPMLCRAMDQEAERSRSMKLIGMVTQFRCETLLENGAVEGVLPELDRQGAIAAKRLEGLGEPALLLGCSFPVRVLAFDTKRNVLTLEPVLE